MRFLVTSALIVTLALAEPPRTLAGEPIDQLKAQVDRVLKLLDDPTLKDKPKDKRVAVRKIAEDIFDFGETAKRSLGRHWAARTPAERDEFVKLFGDLLERSYISKIELYGGEKIQYVSDKVEGDLAAVQSKLVTKTGTDVPIEYRERIGRRQHERLGLAIGLPHALAGARQVGEIVPKAEREFFDRVHDTAIAGSAIVGPADLAAGGRMTLHVRVQISRPFEDFDDGPEPRGAVLAAAEEAVDDRAALDVHRVEGDRVAVRIRLVSGSDRVLDRLSLRQERRLDQEVRLHGRPEFVSEGRGPGMLLEAPHFVHGVFEDVLVRRLEPECDLEFVDESHRMFELVSAQQMSERLDDDLVAAVAEFLQDSLPDLGGDLVVVEEVPGRVDLHQGLPLVFLEDDVELVADVFGGDLLGHIVHVAAHRTTAGARPVAAAGPEDDHPRVDDLPVEDVLIS